MAIDDTTKISLTDDETYAKRKELILGLLKTGRVMKEGNISAGKILDELYPNFVGERPMTETDVLETLEKMLTDGSIKVVT